MEPSAFILAGTGMALPADCVDSARFDDALGQVRGWLETQCGVAARYVCRDETQDLLATRAAEQAIAEACVAPSAIDLVVFAASVPKQPIPSTAPLIARSIGIAPGGCTAFDVNSTCLSFLNGLDVAICLLATGRFSAALVASAEIASRALPWNTDPATAGLFGDGAGAAVILPASTHSRSSYLKAALFESLHQGYELCQLAAGGTGIDFHQNPDRFRENATFRMDGPKLFKLTTKHFPAFVDRLLDRAGWRRQDVDLVVPHQASPHALAHLVRRCGFPSDRVIDVVARYGNQVAASIPTALHLARTWGRISAGTKVLLLGTSAGVSFGGLAIEM
ncbi:MAG: 3-oxoacyl-[acyl-carrier-protein] synthase III C-terminal domain-containing protein [Hyphomicrobiaceae bacterium]